MSGNVSSSNSSAVGSFGGECVPREAPDPCAYVKANPACTAEGLNYLRFIECPAGANDGAAKAVLLVGWCAMLFVAIGTVGDAFFAPAVERIATRLRLPDDVAGATLLALGGAAPDIFTQIAALVESVEPDLRLALSESIGAGLFVATFGKALAVLVGLAWEAKRRVGNDGSHHSSDDHVPHSRQGVAVEPFPYLRDVSAYLAMLILALIAMSSDTVSWELSSALVLSYVLYACVVCFGWGRSAVEPRLVRLAGGVARSPARRTVEDEDEDEEEEEEVAEEADGGRGDVEMSSVGGAPRVRRGVGGCDEDADAEVDAEVEDDEATLLPTGRFLNSAASPSRSTASPPAVSSSSSFVALALAIAEWARVESGLADDRDGVGLGAVAAAPVLLAMSCTMPRLAGARRRGERIETADVARAPAARLRRRAGVRDGRRRGARAVIGEGTRASRVRLGRVVRVGGLVLVPRRIGRRERVVGPGEIAMAHRVDVFPGHRLDAPLRGRARGVVPGGGAGVRGAGESARRDVHVVGSQRGRSGRDAGGRQAGVDADGGDGVARGAALPAQRGDRVRDVAGHGSGRAHRGGAGCQHEVFGRLRRSRDGVFRRGGEHGVRFRVHAAGGVLRHGELRGRGGRVRGVGAAVRDVTCTDIVALQGLASR